MKRETAAARNAHDISPDVPPDVPSSISLLFRRIPRPRSSLEVSLAGLLAVEPKVAVEFEGSPGLYLDFARAKDKFQYPFGRSMRAKANVSIRVSES